MLVAEMSGRNRDVLGLHMDVPVHLTLLAGQVGPGHGSHMRRYAFPYKPGENEVSGGPHARVGNATDHVKHLLSKRTWDYWPECAGGADICTVACGKEAEELFLQQVYL